MVMAVTESLMRLKQPKCDATSPMIAVRTPMPTIEPMKAGYPLYLSVETSDITKAACEKNQSDIGLVFGCYQARLVFC